MYVSHCSCYRFLGISKKCRNSLQEKKFRAMNSTNFLLDISGKWNRSEPMHQCMDNPARELVPFIASLRGFFWQPCVQSRCLPRPVVMRVCTRLCAGLCEANYGWKQLPSRQLGSSQSRITLLWIKIVQIWVALAICKSHLGVITRNIIFQWSFLSDTCFLR